LVALAVSAGFSESAGFAVSGGATSTGEFGSLLKEVFEPKSHAAFQWERWATLRGRRTHVYSYQVAQQYSQWRVSYQRQLEIVPGYRGLVYVEKATNKVLRVTLEAVDIPPSFPIQQAATILDYDYVTISDREFLLPLKAVVRMREAKFLTKNEVVSAILHGVFLAETVSVILQVTSFKTTGKRLFKMAPIHHHFELKGWAEPKIIVRFWIISIICALAALSTLKLR